MRLKQVERGHRLPQKLLLGVIRMMTGRRAPDIIRTLFYRPELFGTHFRSCLQAVMRGPSEWSVGERELFAAFVSRKNQCPF
jgi:hypothetical protein